MGSQEREVDRIKYLIGKLRSITLAVQIVPFAYSSLYIISLILYLFCPEPVLRVLDTLFYVSPTVVLMFLVESTILKLCKWHKCACILPIVPQFSVFFDFNIIELTSIEQIIAVVTPITLAALLLVAAYKVFLKPKHNGRKKVFD